MTTLGNLLMANHVHLIMTSRKEVQSQSGRNGHSNMSKNPPPPPTPIAKPCKELPYIMIYRKGADCHSCQVLASRLTDLQLSRGRGSILFIINHVSNMILPSPMIRTVICGGIQVIVSHTPAFLFSRNIYFLSCTCLRWALAVRGTNSTNTHMARLIQLIIFFFLFFFFLPNG